MWVPGKRKTGRQRKTCKDTAKQDLEISGEDEKWENENRSK